MAAVTKRFAKGNMMGSATTSVVYTVPSGTTSIVKALTVCNRGSSPVKFNLLFEDVTIVAEHAVKANDTITIPFMDQVMHAGEKIYIYSTVGNSVMSFYISGKEVT